MLMLIHSSMVPLLSVALLCYDVTLLCYYNILWVKITSVACLVNLGGDSLLFCYVVFLGCMCKRD